MLEIDFIDETQKLTEDHEKLVRDLLVFANDYLKNEGEVEISVSFVDNPRIQEINRDFRGKDAVTDVISFALEDEVEDDLPIFAAGIMPRVLGDLVISLDVTESQAEEYGHSFERELGFLALHGFLHLNGYDHMTEEDEKEMFGLQDRILSDYGLKRS